MSKATLSATAEVARRLAVTKQHLAGKLPEGATSGAILSAVRDLGYVQWDPISIVAPSHIISLWFRIGNFRLSDLERLLWEEKKLFEHWTPIASIVLTEDYPIYHSLMRRYPESLSESWKSHEVRARRFLAEHAELRKRVLRELKKRTASAEPIWRLRQNKEKRGRMDLGKRCLSHALSSAYEW